MCELGYVLLMKNLLPYVNEACWSMWYSKWEVKVLWMRRGYMLMHSLIYWKACHKECMRYFDDQANMKEMVFIIMAKSMWVQEGSWE